MMKRRARKKKKELRGGELLGRSTTKLKNLRQRKMVLESFVAAL